MATMQKVNKKKRKNATGWKKLREIKKKGEQTGVIIPKGTKLKRGKRVITVFFHAWVKRSEEKKKSRKIRESWQSIIKIPLGGWLGIKGWGRMCVTYKIFVFTGLKTKGKAKRSANDRNDITKKKEKKTIKKSHRTAEGIRTRAFDPQSLGVVAIKLKSSLQRLKGFSIR